MLLSPTRTPTSSPSRSSPSISLSSPPSSPSTPPDNHTVREGSPRTAELCSRVSGAMLSVMPQTVAPTPARPKLTLQTSLPPISIATTANRIRQPSIADSSFTHQSPTIRNTYVNTYEAIPSPWTPVSTTRPYSEVFSHIPQSTFVSTENLTPSLTTQFTPPAAPYVLSIGTRSILRNSPLPQRHLSANSARTPKRMMMFPPIKRVKFSERPTEVMPTPIIDVESDTEDDKAGIYGNTSTDTTREERRAAIEAEDGHSTGPHQRQKRKREWIWRPMPDEETVEQRPLS